MTWDTTSREISRDGYCLSTSWTIHVVEQPTSPGPHWCTIIRAGRSLGEQLIAVVDDERMTSTAAVIDTPILQQSATQETVREQAVVRGDTVERPNYGRDCRK